MIRKFIIIFILSTLIGSMQKLEGQICKPDTSLHRPGYKPVQLPHVKADSMYNLSISILVKRDTFKLVGSTKINVKIDSVRATSVIGLPAGYFYECQNPRCVFLWDTVRCVRIYGSSGVPGIYPILIPVVGYAKISSSSFIQKDTIRDFILVVEGGPAGLSYLKKNQTWCVYPNPAKNEMNIYSKTNVKPSDLKICNLTGQIFNIEFKLKSGVYSADITHLPTGYYWIFNGAEAKKIFVENE
jgi:hypothetical protein